jgi:hypothetical protein
MHIQQARTPSILLVCRIQAEQKDSPCLINTTGSGTRRFLHYDTSPAPSTFSVLGSGFRGFLGSYPTCLTMPSPFVRPSLNNIRSPTVIYSGRCTNLKATSARSPVRIYCRSISIIAQVWLIGPTCSMAWYFVLIVVAWDRISTSATNSRYTFGCTASPVDGSGLSVLCSTTMPFRTSFRRTLRNAKLALCPAEHPGTCIRFRSIVRTFVVVN